MIKIKNLQNKILKFVNKQDNVDESCQNVFDNIFDNNFVENRKDLKSVLNRPINFLKSFGFE